ncbi:MAG: galactokinase [Candidatus Aminicenantes bacterium]|nr:galactokinase [Candidatus Aminicenantes bacterium]
MSTNISNKIINSEIFSRLYGSGEQAKQKHSARFQELIERFRECFGAIDESLRFFSVPGRTEIGGNHTDHNHGRVLAAAVNLDAVAAAAPTSDNKIFIYSRGYDRPCEVDLNELAPQKEERGTTNALIRGIASRLRESDYRIGGFNACISSAVLPGSGLSSSAVVEVLIGAILNSLYNQGKIDAETLAITGQYAENNYFNKPCGLMDQMACAKGGILTIDFKDPQKPLTHKVDFDFSREDFSLLVVNTGGGHANLTEDYASIPREMKAAAAALGKTVCREIEYEDIIQNLPALRTTVGDRAALRALHFVEENRRVELQVEALQGGDFDRFLELVRESGNSSLRWLQNCYTGQDNKNQGITLALALSEKYITKVGRGACRVHGGGFAGTILVLLPNPALPGYLELMEPVFGTGSVPVLDIRSFGPCELK